MPAAPARNVVFDGRWIAPVPSGISVYSLELMRRLPLLEPVWRWHFVFRDEARRDAVMAACAFPSSLRVESHVVARGPLSLRSQWTMPRLLRSLRCDLFHSPNYMVPFFAFGRSRTLLGSAQPADRGCGRCISTIHDAIPLILRDYAPRSTTSRMLWAYRASLRLAIRASVFTITVSEASRNDIATALGLDERAAASLRAIHNGVSERFSPRGAEVPPSDAAIGGPAAVAPRHVGAVSRAVSATPAKVVLYVGRLDPYKNVPALVDAFAMLLRETGQPLHLLIVGPDDPRYPEARLHAQYRGIQDRVTFIRGASDAELVAAYRSADLLVNPSRYEGFGLPMVEAMRCGTPVVCTDGGSQPEIAGGAAEIVPAGDEQALVAAMRHVLFDDARRDELVRCGLARAAEFSWDKTAAATLELYKEAMQS